MTNVQKLAHEAYCYLTTTGRVTGRPHTIEIWFGLEDQILYMLAGDGTGADWVKNALREPEVSVRIGEQHFGGRARLVDDPQEDARARRIVVEKYQPGYGEDLSSWGRTALPLAVDLRSEASDRA